MDVKVSEAPDNSSSVTLKLVRDGSGKEVSVYWEAVSVEGSLFTQSDIHPGKGYARFQKGLSTLSRAVSELFLKFNQIFAKTS